jgi:hypothetical protein
MTGVNGDIITGVADLLEHWGADTLEHLPRRVYIDTECGANVTLLLRKDVEPGDIQMYQNVYPVNDRFPEVNIDRVVAVRYGSIVEGSDAEVKAEALHFPFTVRMHDATIERLEEEVVSVIVDMELAARADEDEAVDETLTVDLTHGAACPKRWHPEGWCSCDADEAARKEG